MCVNATGKEPGHLKLSKTVPNSLGFISRRQTDKINHLIPETASKTDKMDVYRTTTCSCSWLLDSERARTR